MKKLLDIIIKVSDILKNVIGDIFELVEKKSIVAVKAVNEVKDVIEKNDDIFDWVFNKVGDKKGDEVYDVIKDTLPKVAHKIGVVEGFIHEYTSPEAATVALLERLKEKNKEGRAKDWIYLSASLLVAIINKKMPLDLAVMATQKAFRGLFGKKI